jgi:hypothetical protein
MQKYPIAKGTRLRIFQPLNSDPDLGGEIDPISRKIHVRIVAPKGRDNVTWFLLCASFPRPLRRVSFVFFSWICRNIVSLTMMFWLADDEVDSKVSSVQYCYWTMSWWLFNIFIVGEVRLFEDLETGNWKFLRRTILQLWTDFWIWFTKKREKVS